MAAEREKEGSKEEKRRDRGRRALESVGDSCRGVAGSISVDRRHKLFQWTQSSGSISPTPFTRSVSLLTLVLLAASFSRANLCVSIGRKCFQGRLFSTVVVLLFLNRSEASILL